MRLIKAFLRKNFEKRRFRQSNKNLREETMKALRFVELTGPILIFVMNIAIVCILWFGASEVRNLNINVGEVVAIINYGFRITAALSMLSWIVMAFSRGRASANRISEVITTKVDLLDQSTNLELQITDGKVEFENVSFAFPGTDQNVLNEISFMVEAGQTIAVMGSTGSGKSTLFQLIPRMYDVSEGKIKIDGIDIKDVKIETLRRQIGFVPQESILFTGTIENNIAWGKENATADEIIESAIDAQIHDTIEQLPEKYHTRIGQKGVNLSGGQKQRLSIARALIRKPKLLFLDDSTSALDLKTEANLLRALKKYDCTTFIITQKISTAMEADQILLLSEGEVIAKGNHHSLLHTSSLYREIYHSQFAKEATQ